MAKVKNPRGASAKASPAKMGPEPKILRIGVIQAGKIIEERLIRRRENVTIGASPRNTIVVPASSLPKSFSLFDISQGRYSLRFNDAMDGRVSVDTQVLSLDQIRQQGHAHPKGNVFALPLNDTSRGKVIIGEITLLFQFVTPPPIQPRPQLPPSVRGGFFVNFDWTLGSSFITLAVVHFGFLVYLHSLDFPRKIEPDVIPDRFAEYIPEVEKPKALDMKQLAKTGEKALAKEEKVEKKRGGGAGKKSKGRKAKPCDKACQEARAEARRARLAKQVSKLGVLKLLGSKGKGGAGSTKNLIGAGDPGTDADKAFSGVGGLSIAGGGRGGLRGKGGGGSGKAVGIGSLGGRMSGPGQVGTGGMVKERVPKAIVKESRADIDGTMNENAVAQTIRRGMAAITSCYQRALKRDPALTGKISIRLTINTMGKVTSISIDTDTLGDPQVVSCIKGYATRWRFPPPDGGSAEVSVPFNFKAAK